MAEFVQQNQINSSLLEWIALWNVKCSIEQNYFPKRLKSNFKIIQVDRIYLVGNMIIYYYYLPVFGKHWLTPNIAANGQVLLKFDPPISINSNLRGKTEFLGWYFSVVFKWETKLWSLISYLSYLLLVSLVHVRTSRQEKLSAAGSLASPLFPYASQQFIRSM